MMQEKKNKQRALVLVVLLLATAGMLWLTGRSDAPVVNKDLFKPADLTTINEVVLRTAVDTTQLKFSGSQWLVNNQYDADRNMVDVLFATLRQAEPRRPVASSQRDSVASALQKEGVEVTLISGGEKVGVFYAGGNRQKTQAYFMRPGEMPYVMTIPGYRVYTSGVFELAQEGWRSRYVFGFNWRNFSSLTMIKYLPDRSHDDYQIELDDRQFFGIKGMETDTAKLNTFLNDVSLLQVENYTKTTSDLDSISSREPLFVMTIKDVGGTTYSLRVFALPDKDRLVGLIDSKQFAYFREQDIRALNRPKAFFSRE
jgi:hypothetical protein